MWPAVFHANLRLYRSRGPAVYGFTYRSAPTDNLSAAFMCWFAGIALVYGALFGAGHLLFGHGTAGALTPTP